MNEQGQVVQMNHVTGPNKKVFVIPGKYACVEVTNTVLNNKTIAEIPLGPFGWEYEII